MRFVVGMQDGPIEGKISVQVAESEERGTVEIKFRDRCLNVENPVTRQAQRLDNNSID